MTRAISLFFLLCLSSFLAHAQQPKAPNAPEGKLPGPVPAYCKWTVTYEYSPQDGKAKAVAAGANQPEDGRPLNITVIKTANVFSQITRTVSGQISEAWFFDNMQLNRIGGGRIFQSPRDSANPGFIAVQTGDFPEFSWVAPEFYAGRQDWQGLQVLVFRRQEGGASAVKAQQIALFDEQSRLPLLLQTAEERRTYVFKILEPNLQTLPADVQSYTKDFEARMRILIAPPGRPF